jgi:phosphonoacetate hydrolase
VTQHARRTDRLRAVVVLCDPDLADIVDLVAWPEGTGHDRSVEVANAAGAARLWAGKEPEVLWGRSPVAVRDPMAFLPYDAELADPSPPNERNSYPYAAERLLSLFADPRAPDIAVVHTPRHYFPERGGHRGEHGSLDLVQSRAPLLLAGPGVRQRGLVEDHARLVDVAPTLSWLSGVPAEAMEGLDGRPLARFVEPAARYVVGVLWDGAASGDLLHLTAAGQLPNVARLLERGCALTGGAIAEFPSVTLCNHTSILTGVGPGRHGIVGNAFLDRETRRGVLLNDSHSWHRTAEWLRPGTVTVYERVAGARPGALTASVNEPVDRGAQYSTMALIRAGGSAEGARSLSAVLPDPRTSRYATVEWVERDPGFAWATQVDDAGLDQVLRLWDPAGRTDPGWPALTWWNSTLTDSALHAGGPRSPIARAAVRDADRRLGVFLDHLHRLAVLDDVVFLFTADHGFEGTDPACRGDWEPDLRRSGLAFDDVGPGFLYLGET